MACDAPRVRGEADRKGGETMGLVCVTRESRHGPIPRAHSAAETPETGRSQSAICGIGSGRNGPRRFVPNRFEPSPAFSRLPTRLARGVQIPFRQAGWVPGSRGGEQPESGFAAPRGREGIRER